MSQSYTVKFLNAGSKAMNVNGTTPKSFSYSPVSGSIGIVSLSVILEDAGTSSFSNFGSIAGPLTNGVLIRSTINNVTATLATLLDNADLCTHFNQYIHFGNGATSTLGAPIGFGDSADVFIGTFAFFDPLILTDSDLIEISIQDNLTALGTFAMSAKILL